MSSVSFLISELQALATETRRRHPEVREASDKAVALLRANAGVSLVNNDAFADELLRPVFLGCKTKNAKVVTIALGSLQRLIALRAVPSYALPQILATMAEILTQGVDIQLKILQALLSLVTSLPDVHGATMGDALLLCFRLQESRIAVVSSTAAATLRQLVMFVFEKVLSKKETDPPESLTTVRLPDGTSANLNSSEVDAYYVFEDLCLLANTESPNFLKIESLPKTFALELIESVLTNYHVLFHKHPEILLLLHHHLSPLLLKSLSERSSFPLILRSTRVVFILLKQFSDELVTESEVFAMMLIKIISGEESSASDGSRRPHWMRVLSAEVLRGICSDADLIRQYWERYDSENGGSHVFTSLIASLKRLVTEKPALLGVGQQMQGLGVQTDGSGNYKLEQVAGMMANAATTTVTGALGIHGAPVGLSLATCTMKVQCIDQLDKADAPMIPEGYIYVLGLQCLVSIAEGFASTALPAFTSLTSRFSSTEASKLPKALNLEALPSEEPMVQQLRSDKSMIEAGWPALLASLSFLINTNLSDELFTDVLAAFQALTNVSGVLGAQTSRDAFITSLSKLAIPSLVVTRLDSWVEPSTNRSTSGMGVVDGITALANAAMPVQAPALSERNIACLKVLVYSASYLGGSLGPSWFNVLETLQNADYVLTAKGTKSNSLRKMPSNLMSPPIQKSMSGNGISDSNAAEPRPVLLADTEPENVLSAIQGLFESTKDMDDEAFRHFAVALCKLSAEMISMQVSADMEDTSIEDSNGAPVSPTVARAHRRRVSGIQLSRTPRSGDFSVNKLGMIALLNIHRLLYADAEVAWSPISEHLLSIIRHPAAPTSLRLQAAQNLDQVLVIIPRSLSNFPTELVAEVQRRTLDALALQVLTEGVISTVVDIRRMGLETLHSILQTGAHTLVVGWEAILEMLGSVCRPAPGVPTSNTGIPEESIPYSPAVPTTPHTRLTPLNTSSFSDKPNLILIRVAFQSLTLVCDTLQSLSTEQLKLCITTLGLFGRQVDTNIALTAAESLLWSVSDSIQLRRKGASAEAQYNELWMFLLTELLVLCTDARPEVRGGSIQTVFRSLQLYGLTLSLEMWDQCIWKIVFPLLDSLQKSAGSVSPDGADPLLSKAAWDESKILALQSIGSLFNDFLMAKLLQLPDFGTVWNTFVTNIQDFALLDTRSIGTVALRSLEKALKAFKDPAGADLKLADHSCERVWEAWEIMGANISQQKNSSGGRFTQDSLVALVDVVRTLRALSRMARGHEWELERLKSLLSILKAIITYPFSDFRPDIDSLTPLQNNILSVYDGIDMLVPGSPSLILADFSYFVTLPFVAAYELRQAPLSSQVEGRPVIQKVTYIAICKRVMPVLAHLYTRFKASADIYADGTVDAILLAYAIPIKVKYNCPAPSKFGSDVPLWKTATTNFLSVAKECAPRVADFSECSDQQVSATWRRLLEVFEGALLADCSTAAEDSIDEIFDHAFIATIKSHITPYLGNKRITDDIIIDFGKILQHASKIHEVGATPLFDDTRTSSEQNQPDVHQEISSPMPYKGFKIHELVDVVGTTSGFNILPRERFSYWCFDLLFLLCSQTTDHHEEKRRRVAALCLPQLLGRINQALLSYCLDTEIYGDMPFSRTREEELIYILKQVASMKLWSGSLWASQSESPSEYAVKQPESTQTNNISSMIRDLAYRSEKAHLFYSYNLLLKLSSTAKAAVAWLPDSFPDTAPALEGASDVPPISHYNSKELANACLAVLGQEMGLLTQ
ncbi:hypothetical protein M408DRAFT_21910 [Serendipita vermifera MAFF 305830]|uniref:Protein MON2 homolog n=1 Tax=Serendipita vermifera MAFF 305830 TaxID=933852 RepID=A0A0C3BE24_SERVB|nr:hypothetical protein M408DRAFT_21910 [Serendipita vermifera MAFF 305830]